MGGHPCEGDGSAGGERPLKASLPDERGEGPEQQAAGNAGGVVEHIGGVGFAMGEERLVPLLTSTREDADSHDRHRKDSRGKARKSGSGDTEKDEDEDCVLDGVDGVGNCPAGGVLGAGHACEPDHDPKPQEGQQEPEAHVPSVAGGIVREWSAVKA